MPPILLDVFFNFIVRGRHPVILSVEGGGKRIPEVEEVGPNHWVYKLGFELRSVFTDQNHYTFTLCAHLLFSTRVMLRPYPLCVIFFLHSFQICTDNSILQPHLCLPFTISVSKFFLASNLHTPQMQ